MKKLSILILFLLCFYSYSISQNIFQKVFGGAGDEVGTSVQQTTDGGYIITGYTESFGSGGWDVYLIKTDINGDTLWTRTFGASSDRGISVQQTTDGGYIIVGYTGSAFDDVYLIKIDGNGNLLWTKTFGGFDIDDGYSVQQTTDGGYIVAGSTGSFGAGFGDVYLIKTDPNGDTLWTKTFGGSDYERGNFIQQTADGGYILAGFTYGFGAGNEDVYLIKTNASGNLLWTKTFGGTGGDIATSVHQTTDGGYIISGYTNSFGAGNTDAFLIKASATGNLLWTKTFGGTGAEWANSVQQTSDGGYIVAGWTEFGPGPTNAYLIKCDVNGDSVWTKNFGPVYGARCYDVQQTADGGYILVGYTAVIGAGGWEIYLIKTDSLGNSGCNEGSTATIVNTPILQVTNSTTSVSSGSIVSPPISIVGSGAVVTALCTSIGINEIKSNNAFLVAPNFTNGKFTISFEGMIVKGKVEILNILGEQVFTENIFNESKKEINLKNITSGIYFVKVFNRGKSSCKKLIVE